MIDEPVAMSAEAAAERERCGSIVERMITTGNLESDHILAAAAAAIREGDPAE